MPVYQYKGLDGRGKGVSGVKDADSPRSLKTELRRTDIFLVEYSETSRGGEKKETVKGVVEEAGSKEVEFRRVFQRIRLLEVSIATRQMATLVKAGIPLVESLQAVADQTENAALKTVLSQVRRMVKEGAPLHAALKEHPRVFSELYVSMVRAGESSGTLDIVFERLADFIETQVRLRSKVTGVLIYPIIMVFVAVSIIMLLMVFVIPKVTEMFEEMGAQLPIQTRILIAASDFASSWFFWLILAPGGAYGLFRLRRWVATTEKGRQWWDRSKLRLPVFGNLIRMIAVARFSRTLSTLLRSGVPIITALDIVKAIVNNTVLASAIEAAREAIKEGESIAAPLERSKQFPPMITHMVAIGEKTGQLEEMLGHAADTYETQVDARVSTLTSVLEPILIVGMGIMVGFMVFSILMPMLKMNEVISGR